MLKILILTIATFATYAPISLERARRPTAATDGTFEAEAAIFMDGSSGLVTGNQISGGFYKHGIVSQGTTTVPSNTLICKNLVQSTYGTSSSGTGGIITDHWSGISKLDQVYLNDIGHQSGAGDNAKILFSRYSQNRGAGLSGFGSGNILDLSGEHTGGNDYAAYDTIDHNGSITTVTHGEIESGGSILVLGATGSGTTTEGRNNFITSNDLFLLTTSGSTSLGSGISDNYWATDHSGLSTITLTGTTDTHIDNGSTAYPTSPTCDVSMNIAPFGVLCGNEFGETAFHSGASTTLANVADTDCGTLFQSSRALYQENKYQMAYDTGKAFAENCPSVLSSYLVFNVTTPSVQFMGGDQMRWLDYREWLKSVLYLDTLEPNPWYCSDVDGIISTFQYVEPTGEDYNGCVAVIDYLLSSGKCPDLSGSLYNDRRGLREDQIATWQDTVTNPELTPLDTTEPNIDDLGLKILRGKPSSVSLESLRSQTNVISFGATESPFRNETELYFEISQPVALKIDLLDVLGRELGHPAAGQLFTTGKHYANVLGDNLPPGTIYARLTAANGEVRTIKLVKLQ